MAGEGINCDILLGGGGRPGLMGRWLGKGLVGCLTLILATSMNFASLRGLGRL